jgi:hypothetical protein
MTKQQTPYTPLELRVWGTDTPEEEVAYEVTMGVKPAVFINFRGEQGEGLEAILVDSTFFDAGMLADLFDTLARTLRGEPAESKVMGHWSK